MAVGAWDFCKERFMLEDIFFNINILKTKENCYMVQDVAVRNFTDKAIFTR